jgi:hypothetical protein
MSWSSAAVVAELGGVTLRHMGRFDGAGELRDDPGHVL